MFDAFVLARAVVEQRIDLRGARLILFSKPDLISSQQVGIKQGGVVRGENELCVVAIGFTSKQMDEHACQVRMQTAVDLIDTQGCTGIERLDPAADELEKLIGGGE